MCLLRLWRPFIAITLLFKIFLTLLFQRSKEKHECFSITNCFEKKKSVHAIPCIPYSHNCVKKKNQNPQLQKQKEIYQNVNSDYYWIVVLFCVPYIFYDEHILISQTEKNRCYFLLTQRIKSVWLSWVWKVGKGVEGTMSRGLLALLPEALSLMQRHPLIKATLLQEPHPPSALPF